MFGFFGRAIMYAAAMVAMAPITATATVISAFEIPPPAEITMFIIAMISSTRVTPTRIIYLSIQLDYLFMSIALLAPRCLRSADSIPDASGPV